MGRAYWQDLYEKHGFHEGSFVKDVMLAFHSYSFSHLCIGLHELNVSMTLYNEAPMVQLDMEYCLLQPLHVKLCCLKTSSGPNLFKVVRIPLIGNCAIPVQFT